MGCLGFRGVDCQGVRDCRVSPCNSCRELGKTEVCINRPARIVPRHPFTLFQLFREGPASSLTRSLQKLKARIESLLYSVRQLSLGEAVNLLLAHRAGGNGMLWTADGRV